MERRQLESSLPALEKIDGKNIEQLH